MRIRASFRLRLFLGLLFLAAIGVGLQFVVFGSVAERMRQDVSERDDALARVLALDVEEAISQAVHGLKSLTGQLQAGLSGRELATALDNLQQYNFLVEQALVLGPDGKPLLQGTPAPSGAALDFSTRPSFSSALSHPGVPFIDCFLTPGSAEPVISLAEGVSGKVAVVRLKAGEITRLVTTQPSPGGGFLALMDAGGVLIAHSGEVAPGGQAVNVDLEYVRQRLAGGQGIRPAEMDGVRGITSMRSVSGPADWLVMVFEPENHAYAQVGGLYYKTLGGVCLVALIALLVMYAFQAQLLRPIADLTAQVKAVSSGRTDMAIDPYVKEFEPLAESVGVMLGSLRARERALSESRRRLAAVVDAMPSFLASTDAEGCVELWNVEAEKLTRVAGEQAIGRRLEDAVPPLAVILPALAQSSRMGIAVKWEKLHVDFGEGVRVVDVLVYPLSADGDGGAVLRIDDITDRIRMEEVMVHSEKMMTVGGLAAGMAHEINNPLGGIIMSAQNMARRLSPDLPANQEAAREAGIDLESMSKYLKSRGVFEQVETIRELGSRAGKIIANMLGFSRRSHSGFIAVKIEEIVERALELAANDYDLKKNLDFKTITVHRDFDPDLEAIPVNRNQIEQVMLNLFKNATQAMSQTAGIRPPGIWITTRRTPEEAVIEVRDNGPGIPPEVRERIFEPFFTTKEVGQGTGLGLSVSYYIVTTMHNGDITVSSRPDEGTAFTIRLPLRRSVKSSPGSEKAA